MNKKEMNHEEDLMDDLFSQHSTELCEFKSNWNVKISTNALIDQQTETDGDPEKVDKSISTIEYKEIAIQTISTNDAISSMGPSIIDDRKLADWLKKIYPFVEKELNDGCTNVFEIFDEANANDLNIYGSQTLTIGNNDKETITMDSLIEGTACWLSITTVNAPILVISGSSIHDSWCQHTNPRLYIFQPIRNKELNKIIYKELTSIQVKSCIRTLSTNPFNKDYFAGGTVSGDLYIWHYETGGTSSVNRQSGSTIVESHSEISQYGSCSSITWLNVTEKMSQRLLNDTIMNFIILTCHIDGIIILWRIGNGIIKDKIFKIKISENDVKPSVIIGCNNGFFGMENEFFVGTEEGKILLCTITQNLPYSDGNKTHIYDPVVSELESHKFAITTMQIVKTTMKKSSKHQGKELLILISCDLSGEILFHIIDDTTNEWITEPFRTIKMPLPFKNHIVCTKDLSNIIATSENGSLEIFKINQSSKKIIEGRQLQGNGNVIAMSDNECWLVTGCYKGHFQLYCIEKNL